MDQAASTKHASQHAPAEKSSLFDQLNSLAITERPAELKNQPPARTIEASINTLTTEVEEALKALNLSAQDYQRLLSDISQRIANELESTQIEEAVEKWHDLYENFRIGLQLGFRYFTDALINSGEDIPDQDEAGSPWSWHTWETMVGNLLNNFDQYCAKDITGYIKQTGTLLEESVVLEQLSKQKSQSSASSFDDKLIAATFQQLEQHVIAQIEALHQKLQMNVNLEDIIHTPSVIANDFETYLWANYITQQKIGGYGHSLRDRLLGAPRRAPNGQVMARLQYLKVAEADELDKIAGQRTANGQLKRLNDWARENVCEFNIWEKICYDSTRFLPRSSR